MKIGSVINQFYTCQPKEFYPNFGKSQNLQHTTNNSSGECSNAPITHKYYSSINYNGDFNIRRTIPNIDYEEYMAMPDAAKQRFRKKYVTFFVDKSINKKELYDQQYQYMPLRTEKEIDEFINTSKIYFKYKENPIICLGRSPKWFLNAALWMKDGIDDYTFTAFSKYWYRPDYEEGVKIIPSAVPTPEEVTAYRKYLKRIKADPQTIVNNMKEKGKKTVITDYICSGKGACSFMDIMGNYAKDLNILEDFSKSVQIVGIGSLDYMEELYAHSDSFSEPSVPMPAVLRPYDKNIKQEFYNIDYQLFQDMLLNQNTNECRSTYYPHDTWTLYKPDQFKIGLIKDMNKVKKLISKNRHKKLFSSFTPAMYDYRNLLNFRILDSLWQRGLLKTVHSSKV